MLELAAAVDDDRIDSGLVRPDVMPTMLPPLLSNGPLPTPRLTPIESSEFCCPRPALYGGGAGVTAGLAVLGGGSGGSWAVLLRRYGLPYVALYRGSMLGAVIREVSEQKTKKRPQSVISHSSIVKKLLTHQTVGQRAHPVADARQSVVLPQLQPVPGQAEVSVWHLVVTLAVGVYVQRHVVVVRVVHVRHVASVALADLGLERAETVGEVAGVAVPTKVLISFFFTRASYQQPYPNLINKYQHFIKFGL